MNVFLQNCQPNFHFPFTDGSQQLILRNTKSLVEPDSSVFDNNAPFQTDDFTGLSLS